MEVTDGGDRFRTPTISALPGKADLSRARAESEQISAKAAAGHASASVEHEDTPVL